MLYSLLNGPKVPSSDEFLLYSNNCSQSLPHVSFRQVRLSTTKFESTRKVNGELFRCFLLPSGQIRQLSNQAPVLHKVFSLLQVSRHIYTSLIPEELSVYAHTMARPGSGPGPDSSQHLKLSSKALVCFFNTKGISTLWRVSNLEKSDRKSILS